MSRKHAKHHEEHMDESWLVPYADILTLLLALFIVLFASSNIDQEKYSSMMESLYAAFGGTMVEIEVGEGSSMTFSPDIEFGEETGEDELMIGHPLSKLHDSLTAFIDANGLGDTLAVVFQGEELLLTLKSDIWFASGSAQVTEAMRENANIIANLLEENQDPENPFNIIVTGHTDNVPISGRYASNWYLSMDRATNFLVALLDHSILDPTTFSVRGYGEYYPIATNETEEGKQRNRRVEVLISQTRGVNENNTFNSTQQTQNQAQDEAQAE